MLNSTFFIFLAFFSTIANALVIPGADTPSFYLVSSSSNAPSNLLSLRTDGAQGGYSSLTGSGSISQLYFTQGKLTASPRPGSSTPLKPLIGFVILPGGQCGSYGALGFTEGTSTNKCAQYGGFNIQSNGQNAQLGARLTVDSKGGFYACGGGQDVWYKTSPNEGPAGLDCKPIDLYTVPVSG